MTRVSPKSVLAAALLHGVLVGQEPPTAGVDLDGGEHESMRDVFSRAGATLDEWIDRFELYGFLAGRYFDTGRGGARPDGSFGNQAATVFMDIGVRDVARAFLELRLDYFPEADTGQDTLGEAYIRVDDICGCDSGRGIGLKVGRFDLPFGEYYLLEDPNKNRLIGFPAALPYRWDEGVQVFADRGSWGFTASVTEGTYNRNSQSGISPAATLRLHARPVDGLYLSASGLYFHDVATSALCFGGSVVTPVGGGAAGMSPSTSVRSSFASVDLKWQACDRFHLQASAGTGCIDDFVSAFDRTVYWWMFEPSWRFAPSWQLTGRWSGTGTFNGQEGYAFEGRPYANGVGAYGFDLMALQRVAAGLSYDFAQELVFKVEVGFDHLRGTTASGLPNDTRVFTAAELVLTF